MARDAHKLLTCITGLYGAQQCAYIVMGYKKVDSSLCALQQSFLKSDRSTELLEDCIVVNMVNELNDLRTQLPEPQTVD